MQALILKDFYVMWKQTRIFLLVILVFSAIPGSFNAVFAVIYAAMLPYTAMAYDERSKWNQLAAMMPYSDRDIVLSKYAFGWLFILAASAASLILPAALSLVWPAAGSASPAALLLALCVSVCVLDLTLPLMFRFGTERGRLLMFFIIFLVCGSAGAMASIAPDLDRTPSLFSVLLTAALAAVVLTVLSVPLSIRLYRRRRR